MSSIASSGLCKLFEEGDAAKEVVGMICDKDGFLSHVESMRDVYEVSRIEDGDHIAIYRGFHPEASFSKMFSPLWEKRKKEKADTNALLLGLAVALEAFHARGIAHGSLQPEYAVVDTSGGVHLCAVGFSDFKDISASMCGALDKDNFYLSPEVFVDEDCDRLKCDVFSFGSVVYYALTGKHAFESKHANTAYKKMSEGVEVPESVPAKYKRLIEWCWQPATQRPTMREVVEYLS